MLSRAARSHSRCERQRREPPGTAAQIAARPGGGVGRGRLPAEVRARLLALVSTKAGEADPGLLALIKASAGNVSLASMLTEIARLEAVRAIGLPAGPAGEDWPRPVHSPEPGGPQT